MRRCLAKERYVIVLFVQLIEIMPSIQVVPNMDIVIDNEICEEEEDNEVLTSDAANIPELDFGRGFDELTLPIVNPEQIQMMHKRMRSMFLGAAEPKSGDVFLWT